MVAFSIIALVTNFICNKKKKIFVFVIIWRNEKNSLELCRLSKKKKKKIANKNIALTFNKIKRTIHTPNGINSMKEPISISRFVNWSSQWRRCVLQSVSSIVYLLWSIFVSFFMTSFINFETRKRSIFKFGSIEKLKLKILLDFLIPI